MNSLNQKKKTIDMVNRCSVIGCKSLYEKDNVKAKLHRFPLKNPETLPAWIAATGRENGWEPGQSSRLCGNHFEKSDYMVNHGKGVLKRKSVPTIEYRAKDMIYNKRKPLNPSNDKGKTNIEKKKYLNFSNSKNDHDNKDDSKCDETPKHEYKDFNYEIKNDICNRENQCYMFTSSFIKGAEPIVLTPPGDKSYEGTLRMDIDKTIADSNFIKVMVSRLQKKLRTFDIYSLYFKKLKKKNYILKHRGKQSSFNNDKQRRNKKNLGPKKRQK